MSTLMFLLVHILAIAALTTTAVGTLAPTQPDNQFSPDYGPEFMNEAIKIERLTSLINNVRAQAEANPGIFDPRDVEDLIQNRGTVAAAKFMNQRDGNEHRARKLAHSVLRWRKTMGLRDLHAGQFPCDLFAMGLIFESDRVHRLDESGAHFEADPAIWIRLGALGSIVKQLERFTMERMTSFIANAPRTALNRVRNSIDSRRERRLRKSSRQGRLMRRAERDPSAKRLSINENETILHVLRAIAWWLEQWSLRNSGRQATLVLDFEDTDFAFASWSMGDFLSQLDDRFPDLFNRIIGFRYKPKVWSLRTPISMVIRIFKTNLLTSYETDRKLRFASRESQISAYMPRVDENGASMLPRHVSGYCQPPNELLAPAGCHRWSFRAAADQNYLFDANLWQRIYNELYHRCKALPPRV